MDGKEWYSNKELFEKLDKLKDSLSETNANIKKYNGLREKIETVDEKVNATDQVVSTIENKVDHIEMMTEAKSGFGQAVRSWGGWIFSLVTLLILLMEMFIL